MNANSHSHKKSSPPSQGARPVVQQRARENRDKIVKAFGELLKEKPFERISVAEIAKRAGVAVGTLYRRFENKDALIPVVFELYQKRLEEWVAGEGRIEPPSDATLHDVLRMIVERGWVFLKREAHILRAAHLFARLKPETVGDEDLWRAWEEAAYEAFPPLLRAFPDEVKRGDINTAAKMMTYFMNAFFLEKGLYPEESPAAGLKLSDKAFLSEAADILYGYLTTPEG